MKKTRILLALLLGGCSGQIATGDDPNDQANIYRKPVGNGPDLNSNTLAIRFAGSPTFTSVRLVGSEIVGTRSGVDVRGAAVVGALLAAKNAPSGSEAITTVRITSAVGPLDGDIYEYGVQRTDGSSLCDSGTTAVALAGAWDYGAGTTSGGAHVVDATVFTFACANRALGKCVEAGYKPWAGRADLHQACSRMMRADYCGTGSAATRSGVPIQIWDTAGIEVLPPLGPDWALESTWNPSGAACVSRARLAMVSDMMGLPKLQSGALATLSTVHCPYPSARLLMVCESTEAWGPIGVDTQVTTSIDACQTTDCLSQY